MGFIFGLIMLGILKNEYHFYQLKKGKNFLTALVLSTIFGGAIWWLLLILFFVLRNTGALDKMKEENIKHEQEIEFAKLYQEVVKTMSISPEKQSRKKSQFYSELSLDNRFASLSGNKWDLRSRRKFDEVHIDTSDIELEDDIPEDEVEDVGLDLPRGEDAY